MNLILKIVTLIIFFGCSTTNDIVSNGYQPMEFNINTELLSPIPIITNELAINLPLNWEEVNKNQFNSMKNVFDNDSLLNTINLINVQSNGSSVVLIGESKLENKISFLKNFGIQLEKSFHKESIHKNKFRINGLKVDQFIATNNTHTSFHLFVELDNLYLIEFLIPMETYEKQIQLIESTIGTIKKRKENNESYS